MEYLNKRFQNSIIHFNKTAQTINIRNLIENPNHRLTGANNGNGEAKLESSNGKILEVWFPTVKAITSYELIMKRTKATILKISFFVCLL